MSRIITGGMLNLHGGASDLYTPAMMSYDGSTGYYNGSYNSSGSLNAVTALARFKVPSFTGTGQRILSSVKTYGRLYVTARSSDVATASERLRLNCLVQNNAGTTICSIFSETDVVDNAEHTFFFSFSANTGTAILVVDGSAEDDTTQVNRVAPTTGTLDTGATTTLGVGGDGGGTSLFSGQIGFVGYTDAYLTNYTDFFQLVSGRPKPLDETTWTEFGSQPLWWNEHGQMDNNLGSALDMTLAGGVVIGKGGN